MSKRLKPKIMAVDDDERSLRLIEAMLAPNGYDVVLINGGKEAINAVHEQKPDLVILDIMMPDIDGYSLLSAIKADEITRDIPVIMVSSIGYDMNRNLAQELGAVGYITKPFELKSLLDTINRFYPDHDFACVTSDDMHD